MSAWTVIDHEELTSVATYITFTNIPSTYTDLFLAISVRTARSGVNDGLRMQLGTGSIDTGTTYTTRLLQGSGSSTVSASAVTDRILIGAAPTINATASTFGNTAVYIPNYTSSTAKSISSDSVGENNATEAYQLITAGYWTGTGAINTLRIFGDTLTDLQIGSSATLFGITKGSSGGVTVS